MTTIWLSLICINCLVDVHWFLMDVQGWRQISPLPTYIYIVVLIPSVTRLIAFSSDLIQCPRCVSTAPTLTFPSRLAVHSCIRFRSILASLLAPLRSHFASFCLHFPLILGCPRKSTHFRFTRQAQHNLTIFFTSCWLFSSFSALFFSTSFSLLLLAFLRILTSTLFCFRFIFLCFFDRILILPIFADSWRRLVLHGRRS